ncbi:hypothetical protein KA078_02130 [Candidatus Woesebacteria bacterium]|nr:hypothetical protein [Candidatus Woesebacteria bacterium]
MFVLQATVSRSPEQVLDLVVVPPLQGAVHPDQALQLVAMLHGGSGVGVGTPEGVGV